MTEIVNEIQQSGVVAELNGEYYHEYEYDRQATIRGFGPIEKARIADPAYCKTPSSMCYSGHPIQDRLQNARLVPITVNITTTYTVGE